MIYDKPQNSIKNILKINFNFKCNKNMIYMTNKVFKNY